MKRYNITKICKECGLENLSRYKLLCKKCYDKYDYIENIDKHKFNTIQWNKTHREQDRERQRRWAHKHKEHNRLITKLWYQKNKDYVRKQFRLYYTTRKKNDINFRLKETLNLRIRTAVREQYGKKANKTIFLIGCSIQEFREYIEKQFKPGMSWNNYGYSGWHLDHIIPCAHFDLKDLEQQKLCFHYTNLQPLWRKENLQKGCKIEEDVITI